MIDKRISIEDFSYTLPEDRIAKYPLKERHASKLLVYKNGHIEDEQFSALPGILPEKTQLVMNQTRVVQARLLFFKGEGSKPIEIFCLEPVDMDIQQAMAVQGEVDYICLVGRSKKWKSGILEMDLNGIRLEAERLGTAPDGFLIKFRWEASMSFAEILDLAGKTPLPPYLNRESESEDAQRYQTVYASQSGSVAAPTAGLHFTEDILKDLKAKGHSVQYTTLHVGAGTFKPVSATEIADHHMHFEEIHITPGFVESLLNHNGSRTAVGTTSLRTLESIYWLGVKALATGTLDILSQWEAYELPQDLEVNDALLALKSAMKGQNLNTRTQLMILPGYRFRMINSLITNFHQPRSTLLLLVAAAVGDDWKKIYTHALEKHYRFLSYGDSSILHL